MSSFRDQYLVRVPGDPRDNGRAVWEVTSPVEFSAAGVQGTVPVGFQSDLVSPPRFPLSLLALPLCLTCCDMDRPSVVHDWLCQNYRYDKKTADAVLARLMVEAGISAFRRFWINGYVKQRKMRVQWNQPKLRPVKDQYGVTVGWEG